MCDYSLQNFKSRPAKVGDKLTTYNFGTGTRGFIDQNENRPLGNATAVCIRPGTELAFKDDIGVYGQPMPFSFKTAIFRQKNLEQPCMHHDFIEFPNGHDVALTFLLEGQECTVLQLPADPDAPERVDYAEIERQRVRDMNHA